MPKTELGLFCASLFFMILISLGFQESFAELDKNAFENCEIGKYGKNFGLGSWRVTIETKENEKCFMSVFSDIEGGYGEIFCILEIGKFKTTDWNNAWFPLEGTENNCLTIKSGSAFFGSYTIHHSPKQQAEFGILPKYVLCKNGLELIFKIENNSPACVKPSAANMLVERGWGKFGEISIKIITDKSEYKIGEIVRISVLNEGAKILYPKMSPMIEILDDEKNTLMGFGNNDQDYFLATKKSIGSHWTLNAEVPGNYTIKTQFFVRDLPYEETHSVSIIESSKLSPAEMKEFIHQAQKNGESWKCNSLPEAEIVFYSGDDWVAASPTQAMWRQYCTAMLNGDPSQCHSIIDSGLERDCKKFYEKSLLEVNDSYTLCQEQAGTLYKDSDEVKNCLYRYDLTDAPVFYTELFSCLKISDASESHIGSERGKCLFGLAQKYDDEKLCKIIKISYSAYTYSIPNCLAELYGISPSIYDNDLVNKRIPDGVRLNSEYGIQVPPGETKEITLHCNPDEYATSAQTKVTSGDLKLIGSELVVYDPEKIRGESWRGKTTLETGAVNQGNKTGTFFAIVDCKKINTEFTEKLISLRYYEDKIPCEENFEQTINQSENGNFIVVISNQSPDIDPVDVKIRIDNKFAIDEIFEWVDGHTRKYFNFQLDDGEHTISLCSSKGEAYFDEQILVNGTTYGSVSYWHYDDPKYGPEHYKRFMLRVSNHPPGFI